MTEPLESRNTRPTSKHAVFLPRYMSPLPLVFVTAIFTTGQTSVHEWFLTPAQAAVIT